MEQVKALIISDVVKEPRSFQIVSQKQMAFIHQDVCFEMDLQDNEGIGSMYALLTFGQSSQVAIEHAVSNGAKICDVWVLRDLDFLKDFGVGSMTWFPSHGNKNHMQTIFDRFFETCEPFSLFGDYKGDSYTEMHKYDSSIGIFSEKADAELFLQLVDLFKSNIPDEERERVGATLLKNRSTTEYRRFTWEHEMD